MEMSLCTTEGKVEKMLAVIDSVEKKEKDEETVGWKSEMSGSEM